MVKGGTEGGDRASPTKYKREDWRISDKSHCTICQHETIIWLVVFKSICIVPKLEKRKKKG